MSRSRIATGTPLGIGTALDVAGLTLVLAPWLAVLVLSATPGSRAGRGFAIGRGLSASVALVALVYASGRAAGPALAALGGFARYSLGPAVWLSAFAAFTLVVASRRETGASTPIGWFVALSAPVGIAALAMSGVLERLGIVVEYHNLEGRFWPALGEHMMYAAASIVVATVLGVALGILAFRQKRFAGPVFTLVSAFQTIPGLALI
ncbi:hypothetical protein EG835_10430, partial [bacterium]|nr:hypothetical protein [bacterium]